MGYDEAGVRRRGQAVVAALAMVVCTLALPAVAVAADQEFVVNSTAEEVDATLGTGGCLTAGGKCTLRAAIEEANENANEPERFDTILFDEVVFGGPGATIALVDPLPAIVQPLYIKGTRECESGASKPCVGLSGPADGAALTVQGTTDVYIERLAVTDTEVGISVEDSTSVRIFGSWFGVKLGGGAGPNHTGVLYGPGSDNARIGQPEEGQGNLFANNTGVGLDLFGASGAQVLGNRFGVGSDGSTPAANGEDIEVTSDTSGGGDVAEGNEIGGRVEPGRAAGLCDRECNLISGATGIALDLQGEVAEEEGPAVGTSVAGNYFGLTADGAGSAPNTGAGIRVGAAPQTVIGGPKAGDANRFSGGSSAVDAGPGAADLVVRGNLIGIDGAGAAAASPDAGLAVDSEGLASAALEALLEGNEIWMEGGTGIAQQGFGARIADNRISGAELGIRTSGSAGPQGNLIEGNSVAQSELDAILLENGPNEVVGNRISGAGSAGIEVRGALPFGVSENVIGGDGDGDENEISGSAGAAILISNVEGTMTTVARNRGSANAGLFVDLLATSPGSEPNGPNGGIAPPPVLAATTAEASGTGEPGATVRVFRKRTSAAGEIEGFLGATTVGGDGSWKLTYATALAAGTPIAAGQTSEAGGSSELALASTGGGGPTGGGSGEAGGDAAGSGDRRSPRTAILRGPRARSASTVARFRFASDELGTRFECRLDRRSFRACASPKRYAGLRPGEHVFAVRAIDAAGNVDPSPAKRAFTVVAGR